MATISELQKRAWENKIKHGFNLTNVERDFCLLNGEVSEAYLAWLRGEDELDLELADVFIYLVGLAEMNHIDLEEAVLRKMEINEKRKYKKNAAGVLVKDEA
jgi:NTP pyrophosphatase (non-canonical NTP hydrolase)